MELSNQRLGDNPRDHDGSFKGFYPRESGDIYGLKADIPPEECENPSASSSREPVVTDEPELHAWKIYPAPPPPHWKWRPAENGPMPEQTDSSGAPKLSPSSDEHRADSVAFKFEDCEIPADDVKWAFGLNNEGVFEVFATDDVLDESPQINGTPNGAVRNAALSPNAAVANGDRKGKRRLLSRIPDLREYFSDLDFLLGVCSDGPAKSFAFRRLKYLASKWSLYCLLNEYQELADMKAVPHR